MPSGSPRGLGMLRRTFQKIRKSRKVSRNQWLVAYQSATHLIPKQHLRRVCAASRACAISAVPAVGGHGARGWEVECLGMGRGRVAVHP